MKRSEKNEPGRSSEFASEGQSEQVEKPQRTPSPSPPQAPPEIRPDRTFQPRPKSPHIPDLPDDPTRERPSVPSEPPPEISPNKNPQPIGPPPAERKPFFSLVPMMGGVVGFRFGFLSSQDRKDYFEEGYLLDSDPIPTWDRKRLMIVLFTPRRGFE